MVITLQITQDIYNKIIENLDFLKPILIYLSIAVSVNIIVELFKILGNLFISKKELRSKKILLREEIRIKIMAKLFEDLNKLSLYDKNDSDQMLLDMKEINLYIRSNQIYLTTKIQDISREIIDYFNSVLTDYSKKDIKKEIKLFEKYNRAFNG
jgi:hypothetical protein